MVGESSDNPIEIINNSSDTETATEDDILAIHIVIWMLGIFSIVGTIGNGLVMYVFSRKGDRLTSTIFILALAGTDFTTCLVIIPFSIVVIYVNHGIKYDFLCKLYQFLITSNVPLSAFIMVAIAIDRYLCICHPFLHAMTVKRAKIFVSILAALASVLGIITSLGYALQPVPPFLPANETALISETLNTTEERLVQWLLMNESIVIQPNIENKCALTNATLSDGVFLAYQKLYASFYLISLLIVMILYALIYRSILVRRSKRLKQKAHCVSSQSKHTSDAITSANQSTQTSLLNNETAKNVKVEVNGSKVMTKTVLPKQVNGSAAQAANKAPSNAIRDRKDHNRLANIKTAAMLFVVTVVFTVAFLPAWLMAHNLLGFNVVVFYMYFAYNVANPFIYAFMNQMFRDDLKEIIQKCHTCVSKR